jgi:hypothetical protein
MRVALDTLAIASLVAVAISCGGARTGVRSPDASVVEIPRISDRDSRKMSTEEPPPAARRESPVAAAEANEDDFEDPEFLAPWGHGGGGPDCDRAAECCLKFVQFQGPQASLTSMCESLRQGPSVSCTQLLASFRSIAPQAGIQCN